MNSKWKGFFADQNLTTIKITLSLIGLVTSLIFLQNYNDFAFSQIGNETGLVPNGENLITPGSPTSNQTLGESQAPSGFVTNGKINTVINVPNGKWLASGNWSIILNNGNVTTFETKMTWYNSSGTNAHTHELTNFRAAAGDIQTLPMSGPANQIIIKGVTDVGSNSRVSWFEVPTIITINDRKILSISLDDNKTNHHFGGQPLLGIVDSFVPCSDLPGPNMEILPSCSVSPVGEQGFALTNDSSAFAPSNDSLTYGGDFARRRNTAWWNTFLEMNKLVEEEYRLVEYLLEEYRLEMNKLVEEEYRLEMNKLVEEEYRLEMNKLVEEEYRLEMNKLVEEEYRLEMNKQLEEEYHLEMNKLVEAR